MRLLLCSLFFISFSAMSHQTSRSSSHRELKWPYTTVPIRVTNPSSTLPGADALINQSLLEWSEATGFNFLRVASGPNQIQFLNNFSQYGTAIVGLTEVSYASNGTINSAVVKLNEDNYTFVSTPGFESLGQVYLKDVLTHELGHFAGLAHSEVLDSSMFYLNFPGQSELAADDRAAIRNKYQTTFGKISGRTMGGNQVGVFGVHVQAVSQRSGEIVSSVSDENGNFEIGGLDLDEHYYLLTSPLKDLSRLPSHLATVQKDFCPGAYVASFYSPCGKQNEGIAQVISVTATEPQVDVGVVSINCTLKVQDNYIQEKIKTSFDQIEIFNIVNEPRFEKAHVGYFNLSELSDVSYLKTDKFKIDLTGLSVSPGMTLKLKLISQGLGSLVDFSMVVRKSGSPVSGSPFSKVIALSGVHKLDLSSDILLDSDPLMNVFEIDLSARKVHADIEAKSIPDFTNFSSKQTAPYLLMMKIATPNLFEYSGSQLSDNSACLDAPFAYSGNNNSANTDESPGPTAKAASAIAGCGTIDPPSGPGPGPGSFFGLVTLGFLLSFLSSSFSKRQKNFLS